ncbi:pseudaminic acid synthase [Sulfuricystis multivorans]|uniref:pseudaminic acid synthase n=1 Tax=Sulfuricystis multivorans TaxID=2211108 RepID=UPI000F833013|nr:pseudaminic acid synthase [Sulfuricystis multivorans]
MKIDISIEGRTIGQECPPFLVAELSANHNGSLERALATLEAAKRAGADAVKLQTYTADTMTIDSDQADFKIRGGPWDGYTLYRLYEEAHTPSEWHRALFDHARSLGITIFSTPFDESAVELLESLGAPAYKIASFELTDLPLLQAVAQTGKPIILSTGMASCEEIGEALETIRNHGGNEIVLLHCVSSYPAPLEQANLRMIPRLAEEFRVPVGLSDHTLGTTAATIAVALGACMIEKHFTLSRAEKGPDSAFSIEPQEFAHLAEQTRAAWHALGSGDFVRPEAESTSRVFRRSIYFVRDLPAGAIVGPEDIRRIRPGYGLAPKHFGALLGRRLKVAVTRGTATRWEHFDE